MIFIRLIYCINILQKHSESTENDQHRHNSMIITADVCNCIQYTSEKTQGATENRRSSRKPKGQPRIGDHPENLGGNREQAIIQKHWPYWAKYAFVNIQMDNKKMRIKPEQTVFECQKNGMSGLFNSLIMHVHAERLYNLYYRVLDVYIQHTQGN